MSLGTCTKCKAAPATHQDDVISSNVFCDTCWAAYLKSFELLDRKAVRLKPEMFDKAPRKTGPPALTISGGLIYPDQPGYEAALIENGEYQPPPHTAHEKATYDDLTLGLDGLKDSMRSGQGRVAATSSARPHYFDLLAASPLDIQLKMAIGQGYVPPTCLLGGAVAMSEVMAGRDPCAGCHGPRDRCKGRPKRPVEPA